MADPVSFAIETENLSKRFGRFIAVNSVTFNVRRGTIFGFLGPNGAGKTTTMRMLLGLLRPSGGHAKILGYDVAHQPRAVKQRIGYMSQRFSLYEELTVRENLQFYGGVYGLRGREIAARRDQLLDSLGCISCHSTDGSRIVGPTLKGIYDTEVNVVTGGRQRTVKVDEDYMTEAGIITLKGEGFLSGN